MSRDKITVFVITLLFLGFSQSAWAEQGIAIMEGTGSHSKIRGEVSFVETSGGINVRANFRKAPPGLHGFHIHEFGSCDKDGNAAGSHYNPENVKHGHLASDGYSGAHAGDLGNIEIDEKGRGEYETTLPGLKLGGGERSIGGRAVVMHESQDDFGQPVGNAGARIACGIIRITGK